MYMGQFDEAQHYLLAFTNLKANRYSKKIFFEIRKQKYFEALDKYAYDFAYVSHFCNSLCVV